MAKLTLELDKNALDSFSDLMVHYNLKNQADVVAKALSVLKIAAYVDSTHGELIARKGDHETRIIVS